uniref:Putative secreted peptide n=1 Tax=Anopheles braziliensis TaxID=58242 RepID=A0A2M3ZWL8_9DIPT
MRKSKRKRPFSCLRFPLLLRFCAGCRTHGHTHTHTRTPSSSYTHFLPFAERRNARAFLQTPNGSRAYSGPTF